MAIKDDTVLKKMMGELQEAITKENQGGSTREHIRAIRLLCDLMLEEQGSMSKDAELKKMMGSLNAPSDQSPVDHEDANGKSLFDF